jgi:hypothetical protein
MKKLQLARLVIVSAALTCAMVAKANSYWVQAEGNGGNYGGYGPYQAGQGGEFTFNTDLPMGGYVNGVTSDIINNQGLPTPNFQSFCVSATVFYPGQNYSVTPSGYNDLNDPLTAGVAWLYSQFAEGTLSGYDYTDAAGRQASAAFLQDTIWALMDNQEGMTAVNQAGNPFLIAAEAQFGGTWSGADAPVSAGTDGVYILDLTSGGAAQSQLYHTPDGGITAGLLGGALLGLQAIRRKLSR